MKITILGSGGWEGIPAPFCDCTVCKKAVSNPNSKDRRTRPELLFEVHQLVFHALLAYPRSITVY